MNKKLLTGNEAAAWACRLSKPSYVPVFPITPQTACIEALSKWKSDGDLPDSDIHQLESEHSVLSAAIGASSTGSRTFTATSSQGLMLMYEMMWIASGNRLPIVMVNISRGLSAPITLWPSHEDFLTCRDTGWIMFHAKTVQEVLDFTIMAYAIAEDPRVLLPVLVNMDGYVLSFTDEPVEIPDQEDVDEFLGIYQPEHSITVDQKLVIGAPVMWDNYQGFKVQQHIAMMNSLKVIEEVFVDWKDLTGRHYEIIEEFNSWASNVIVTQGSMTTTAKHTVRKMSEEGYDIGLINLPVIRPFPKEYVEIAFQEVDRVGILDRNLMPGAGGIMEKELKAAMYNMEFPPRVKSYIVGLGGWPQTEESIRRVVLDLIECSDEEMEEVEFNDVI